MVPVKQAAPEFLAKKRIAVTGVSRTMRECAELGIRHVRMHRGLGAGGVSPAATEYGREHGITVIDGGCPLMFRPTADTGHKLMRLMLAGNVPKQV